MYNPQPGDSLDKLDTPAVLIDLNRMEANIENMMSRFRSTRVRVRPHLKTTKSPELAHILMAAGAVGGCVSKVSEAEVMAAAGIEDLLITTEVVGPQKIARLVALVSQHSDSKVVIDSKVGASELDRALGEAGLSMPVLIELNVGQNRCGVAPGEEALELAQFIKTCKNLRLVGVQGYEGHLQHVPDPQERARLCLEAMQRLAGTVKELRQAGVTLDIVTTGGTGTADICATCEEVTEVQPGSFIFMDTDYRNALGATSYSNALTILSTVISHPTPTRAVIDAGLKSLSTDSGPAEPKGLPGVRYRPGGDEHGILEWDKENQTRLEIGQRIEMIPSHIDTTINLHDYYYAHRNGRIEAIWPISARGKVQ
ncbi:MAG TPA: DSD1 family PLP-dependent enzyme [Chloroflexia bacterium]|nr:DSD1 family PLP-dependent enzyme [Chloroflexia bacterium]